VERFESTWARLMETFETHRSLWVANMELFSQVHHMPEIRGAMGDNLQVARTKLAANFVQGRAEQMPFADNSFDFLTMGYARRHGGPLATCGCFGRPDTPPTALHLFVDLVLAAAAAAVAAGAPSQGTLVTQLAHQPWAGLPLLFVSAVGLWLTALALSALAALTAARSPARPAPARSS